MRPSRAADGSWSVVIDPAWPGFAGHFPGNPILPGAELVDWALFVAQNANVPTNGIAKARFLAPVRPNDSLKIEVARSTVRFMRNDQVIAEVVLSS
jgi:3-hydroxymyristoyl/3-hydroxydecanoyl-(acyl carrier protein) dehydratase